MMGSWGSHACYICAALYLFVLHCNGFTWLTAQILGVALHMHLLDPVFLGTCLQRDERF